MIRVEYNGLIADIREEDLKDGLGILKAETPAGRQQILRSVTKALDAIVKQVKAGKPLSPQQMQDTANDIGIWFAGEVFAGRTEKHKTAPTIASYSANMSRKR